MVTTENITVVMPSYNRAHLLARTIPSYLQPRVKEIILIDDCSPDNTEEVVKALQKKYPGKIRYYRQPRNMKQTAAKNKGVELCETEWIYFGDDDSILTDDSIEYLYSSALSTDAGIVGARALYMREGEDKEDIDLVIKRNTVYAEDVQEIVDIKSLHAKFNLAYHQVVEVPFCQACLLMKSDIAKKVKFDLNYIGNAYREETDFIVRCSKIGAKIVYDSRAIQYNLPPSLATGGSRGGKSKIIWRYKWQCIRNNWYFLKNNWSFLKEKYNIKQSRLSVQIQFASGYFTRPLFRLLRTGKVK